MIDPAEHLGLVRSTAGGMCRELPRWVERDELLAAGYLGLVEAAHRFDETKGVPFGGYAQLRVRGAMIDQLRKSGWLTRSRRRYHAAPVLSLDRLLDETDPDYLEHEQYEPEQQVMVAERNRELAAAVGTLKPREQFIVREYVTRRTQVETADELGVTQGRISQIRKAAFGELRDRLAA